MQRSRSYWTCALPLFSSCFLLWVGLPGQILCVHSSSRFCQNNKSSIVLYFCDVQMGLSLSYNTAILLLSDGYVGNATYVYFPIYLYRHTNNTHTELHWIYTAKVKASKCTVIFLNHKQFFKYQIICPCRSLKLTTCTLNCIWKSNGNQYSSLCKRTIIYPKLHGLLFLNQLHPLLLFKDSPI